jgi:hypothetical protein
MRPIRPHPFTAIEASIFLGSASLMLAPRFEICLGASSEEHGPRALEDQTRLLERRRGAVGALAGSAARIEAARHCHFGAAPGLPTHCAIVPACTSP